MVVASEGVGAEGRELLLFRKNPKQKVPRYKVRFQAFAEFHRLVYPLAYETEKKGKEVREPIFNSVSSLKLSLNSSFVISPT